MENSPEIILPSSPTVRCFAEIAPQPSKQAIKRLQGFDEYARAVLKEGDDYGMIPGTNSKSLFLAGAEKLCAGYGLTPRYEILPSSVADHAASLFQYDVRCLLAYQGVTVGEGLGTCNSREKKYSWRWVTPDQLDTIPELRGHKGQPLEIKTTKWGKTLLRVPQWEVSDLANTMLQMASKRALVKAVRSTFGLSAYGWTSDVGDRQAYAEDSPQMPTPEQRDAKPMPRSVSEAVATFTTWLGDQHASAGALEWAYDMIGAEFSVADPTTIPDAKLNKLTNFLNQVVVPALRREGFFKQQQKNEAT